jgi:nucleobase:cation symporter-1, NCS1 family
MIALATGVSMALSGLAVPVLKPLYDYSWFVGFFVSGGLYWLLMRGSAGAPRYGA